MKHWSNKKPSPASDRRPRKLYKITGANRAFYRPDFRPLPQRFPLTRFTAVSCISSLTKGFRFENIAFYFTSFRIDSIIQILLRLLFHCSPLLRISIFPIPANYLLKCIDLECAPSDTVTIERSPLRTAQGYNGKEESYLWAAKS